MELCNILDKNTMNEICEFAEIAIETSQMKQRERENNFKKKNKVYNNNIIKIRWSEMEMYYTKFFILFINW